MSQSLSLLSFLYLSSSQSFSSLFSSLYIIVISIDRWCLITPKVPSFCQTPLGVPRHQPWNRSSHRKWSCSCDARPCGSNKPRFPSVFWAGMISMMISPANHHRFGFGPIGRYFCFPVSCNLWRSWDVFANFFAECWIYCLPKNWRYKMQHLILSSKRGIWATYLFVRRGMTKIEQLIIWNMVMSSASGFHVLVFDPTSIWNLIEPLSPPGDCGNLRMVRCQCEGTAVWSEGQHNGKILGGVMGFPSWKRQWTGGLQPHLFFGCCWWHQHCAGQPQFSLGCITHIRKILINIVGDYIIPSIYCGWSILWVIILYHIIHIIPYYTIYYTVLRTRYPSFNSTINSQTAPCSTQKRAPGLRGRSRWTDVVSVGVLTPGSVLAWDLN